MINIPYRCRYPDCNAKVERIRKYCPECGRRMYKGDWVRDPADASHIVKCAFCKGSGIDPVPPDCAEYAEAKEKIPSTVPSKNVTVAEGMVLSYILLFTPVENARARGKFQVDKIRKRRDITVQRCVFLYLEKQAG